MRIPRLLALLLMVLALVTGRGEGASARMPAGALLADDPLVVLPGHTLAILSQATLVPAGSAGVYSPQTAGSEPLTLTIVLNRTDEAGFEAFLQSVRDPSSPNYQQFMSQSDLANFFGPSQPDYDAVLSYLQQYGFSLTQGSSNRLTLTVQGTRADAEQAFYVQINDYQLGDRSFFANSADPAVPSSVAPSIQAVVGLNNLAQPVHDTPKPPSK